MLRANKKLAGYWLKDVPQDKVFWCQDGRVFKSLQELAVALEGMDEGSFSYHSSSERNDFSRWVQDVIGDEKLAAQLKRAGGRSQAAETVAQRVAQLQRLLR